MPRRDNNLNYAETEVRHYVVMRKELSRIDNYIAEAEHEFYGINSVPFKSKEEAFYINSTAPPTDTIITRMFRKDELLKEKAYLEEGIKRTEERFIRCKFTQVEWEALYLRYEKEYKLEQVAETMNYSAQNVSVIINNALDKFEKSSRQM